MALESIQTKMSETVAKSTPLGRTHTLLEWLERAFYARLVTRRVLFSQHTAPAMPWQTAVMHTNTANPKDLLNLQLSGNVV